MISQVSVSSEIHNALFKGKETTDGEYEEASDWITDIIENGHRLKYNACEICDSAKQLEVHHVKGRKHGNECITVCSGCHKTLTDKQKLWDKSWLDPDSENKDSFLIRGFIDICELKYQRTDKGIYRLIAEILTEGFSYE
jgi:hypothetical protein